jgi:hypothetical protein
MVASNRDLLSAEFPHKEEVAADGGTHRPMPQQATASGHGHEMHPQKLVRLVGCHDLNAGKNQAGHRRH